MKGLVLGAYITDDTSGSNFKLTPTAEQFDKSVSGVITDNLNVCGVKQGKARILYRVSSDFGAVAVVGVGKEGVGYNNDEDIEEGRENVRTAASAGCKALQDLEVSEVCVEGFGDPEASAEGAHLSTWIFQEYKNPANRKKIPIITPFSLTDEKSWQDGVVKAKAQNFARFLADTPANRMTPTIFCQLAEKELTQNELKNKVKVTTHDEQWATSMKMDSFLSVGRGSAEPSRFLEVSYMGGPSDQKPIVLVGKGVTFDSGGISLKPSLKMDHMRADMQGAACVVATIKALGILNVPINVIGLTPLTENLPGGKATKPGDVVTAMNGKNIIVDNTDAEGRLILADALCYAGSFSPCLTVDVATLTGSIVVALGGAVSGVFSTSTERWTQLQRAGAITGDRMWRMPLYKDYTRKMTDFPSADVNNLGKGFRDAGTCKAAAFLKEFIPNCDWMHIDIAGVLGPDNDLPYLSQGMSGRPVRTLIQFLSSIAKS